ncbi:MAG: tagaturonate reductase [Chitinophagaceae bacterium]|nr:tagaturonate reductase [Chitinophagaceae bacterium]
MQLNSRSLPVIDSNQVEIPPSALLLLPEKVLQFGTGVLLRGLPDFFIDKANKNGIFNGRIVVIKSTNRETTDSFQLQDNLYTVIVRGIEDGKNVNKKIINAAISRVLNANNCWNEIVLCAENPDLKIILSNTTEVGISLLKESIFLNPPVSFPAKLLTILWKRYEYFNGSLEKGMVIIPTELVSENGKVLKSIIKELAVYNQLDSGFMKWLDDANDFCNSLVDRIVPGKLSPEQKQVEENLLGYTDDLMILCEPYSLWAIESSKQSTREILSFAAANPTVKVVDNINQFKELKLRLLNGTHSFSCALAMFCGFSTVLEAMRADYFRRFVKKLMFEEIKPLIVLETITDDTAQIFAEQVIDRFSNDSIEHKWINISMQYSSKMAIRNVPLILKNDALKKELPQCMILGFAAYLLFMKTEKTKEAAYETTIGDQVYQVTDEKAEILYQYWQAQKTSDAVEAILSDAGIWGTNLTLIPGFSDQILESIERIKLGAENILRSLTEENK